MLVMSITSIQRSDVGDEVMVKRHEAVPLLQFSAYEPLTTVVLQPGYLVYQIFFIIQIKIYSKDELRMK